MAWGEQESHSNCTRLEAMLQLAIDALERSASMTIRDREQMIRNLKRSLR